MIARGKKKKVVISKVILNLKDIITCKADRLKLGESSALPHMETCPHIQLVARLHRGQQISE